MKPVVCLYCEGTDAKVAVLSKEKGVIKIHRLASMAISRPASSSGKFELLETIDVAGAGDEISFDSLDTETASLPADTSEAAQLQSALYGLKISQLQFIPAVTEPIVNFHQYEGPRDENKKKLLQAVIADIQNAKGITVDADSVDVTEINEKTMLSVFIEGDIPCVHLINQLAYLNKRRYLKIPTIKTAELSLAHYVGKSIKFFPEDNTLIIYIGKEYSKLIFLEGQKLKHIGATLDIGTKNLHTYDVYFSKILLEMENGGIPKLDNIIICGEDRSENLILSFYGTFPEANVSELKFDGFDLSLITEEESKNLALYAIPIAVGIEYFDELEKTYVGVNFLPKYIQENQKFLQFGWHSYAILPILFGVTFYFTFETLSNYRQIDELDFEIERLTERQMQNQALIDEITPLDSRINSFDATQAILDSAAQGAGIWNKNLQRVCDFIERRRNFWLTKLEATSPTEITVAGYALSRSVLTEFAQFCNSSVLKAINYEPLRDKSAFNFNMKFNLSETDSLSGK